MSSISLEAAEQFGELADERSAERVAPSDEQLMAAVRARADEAAFEELVRRHTARAHSIALACLGGASNAEDAVQESFLHLVRARRSYRPKKRFAPWFYTLLRNVCRDELRRRAHRPRALEELPDRPFSADPCAELAAREDCRAACRAFARLPAGDREILALRLHAGLDFSEIARAVGLNAEAVKKRAYRALERLRRDLAKLL